MIMAETFLEAIKSNKKAIKLILGATTEPYTIILSV